MLFAEVINVSPWIQSETNCTFYLFADAERKTYFNISIAEAQKSAWEAEHGH